MLVRIVSLMIGVLLLAGSAAVADDDLGELLLASAGMVVAGASSIVCTAVNVHGIATHEPRMGWGGAGVASGGMLFMFGIMAIAAGHNDEEGPLWLALGSASALTVVAGVWNMTGASARESAAGGQGISLTAAIARDGAGRACPGLAMVWRF